MTPRRKHSLAEVLGPLEAEIMDVVWDSGEVTVRELIEDGRDRRFEWLLGSGHDEDDSGE